MVEQGTLNLRVVSSILTWGTKERSYVMLKKIIITLILLLIPTMIFSNDNVILPGWQFGESTNVIGIKYFYGMIYNDQGGLAAFSVQQRENDDNLWTAILLIPYRKKNARVSPLKPLVSLDGVPWEELSKSEFFYSTRGYTFIFPVNSMLTKQLKKAKTLTLEYMRFPIGENTVKYDIVGINGIIQVAAKFQEDEIKHSEKNS